MVGKIVKYLLDADAPEKPQEHQLSLMAVIIFSDTG